jgi:hypothetical protein
MPSGATHLGDKRGRKFSRFKDRVEGAFGGREGYDFRGFFLCEEYGDGER